MIILKKQSIKNHPHYFFSEMINIKDFDPNLQHRLKKVLMLLFVALNISQ